MNNEKKLIEVLLNSSNVAIFAHIKPDGDAIGACLALKFILQKLGKTADVFCDDHIPDSFSFLPSYDIFNKQSESSYDLAIAVDSGDLDRIGRFSNNFLKCKETVCIDHHKTNDKYAKINYVIPKYASTCEIIYDLANALNVEINRDIAYCLYVGISTDTGNFSHSNTSSETLLKASTLLKAGVKSEEVAYPMFKKASKGRMLLLSRALSGMRFFCDDKICIISVLIKTLEGIPHEPDITSGFVDYAINIDSVTVGVCIFQVDRHTFKVSMRSKNNFDCSDVCLQFGGGGHINASGCQINGFYEDVIDKLVKAISDRM